MADGDHSLSRRQECSALGYGHSARRWTSAAHLRKLLPADMVVEWTVPFHFGRSADPDKSGAKPGNSGWPRGKPAHASSGRNQGRGRTGSSGRLPICEPRLAGARQRPVSLCLCEYYGASQPVSNFATLNKQPAETLRTEQESNTSGAKARRILNYLRPD